MEQIKLITSHTINDLEKKINEFMASLDDNTDILDVNIDSDYHEEPFIVLRDHLLATIRYQVYKENTKSSALDDLLQQMYEE